MNILVRLAFQVLVAFLIAPAPARAMMAVMELRQVVTTTDEIVVARLQNVHGYTKGGYDVGEGELVVERVVWGDAKPGDKLPLRWRNLTNVACPRTDHTGASGRSLLWLLGRDRDGSVHAGHYQVWPREELEMVLDTLAAYPYQVIAPDRNVGEPVVVTIIFRNATRSNLTIPGFEIAGGRITHGDGFALTLARWDSQGTTHRVALGPPLHHDSALSPMVLAPGESMRVEIPISKLVDDLAPGLCRFEVHVNGQRTEHRFRVRTEWQTRLARVEDTPAEMAFHVQTVREGAPEWGSAISILRMKRSDAVAVTPELMRMCDSLETKVRCEVIRLLTWMQIDAETRLDFFLDRVDDPIPEVRDCAMSGACSVLMDASVKYRRDEVLDRLLAQLDDEDPTVRRAAVYTLSNLRTTAALPALNRLVRYDGDPEVRDSAARAVDTIEGRNCCKCRENKVLP